MIDNPYLPNLAAVCQELGGNMNPPSPEYTHLYNQGLSVLEPGYAHFKRKIIGDDVQALADLAAMLHLFKSLVTCTHIELLSLASISLCWKNSLL